MKKIISALVFLTIVICGIYIIQANESNSALKSGKPIIKIGATLPLTGNAAEAGQAAREAMIMTLEVLQKQGLKYDYHLIFEDNQMSPQKVALTTNKLIHVDKVSAVFSFWGLMSNVAAAIANANDVLNFSCTFGENSTKGKYNFNFAPLYTQQAKIMVDELKRREIKSVALFIDASDIREQYEAVEAEIKENSNIKIVFSEHIQNGERNYRFTIAKAHSRRPDMYLISGYPPSPIIFLRQLKQITGRNDNVTSIDTFIEIPREHRSVVNGLWYVDSNWVGNDLFQEQLIARYVTPTTCTGTVASNLEIFITAFENADIKAGEVIPDNNSIVAWIFDNIKDFKTVNGITTVINEGLFVVEPTIKTIQN